MLPVDKNPDIGLSRGKILFLLYSIFPVRIHNNIYPRTNIMGREGRFRPCCLTGRTNLQLLDNTL